MSASTWIDDLYAAFVEALPGALADPARDLAATLGLAPSRAVPWSEVFSNEVTLAAPALVAEAMPGFPAALVREAVLAHLLAVIEAFGTDRIEDGQVPRTPALAAVLAHARAARDAALAQVTLDAGAAYAPAERETLAAIHAEQTALRSGEGVSFDRYLAVSHGKQRVGLPASLALARAAGWDARRVQCLERLLDAVWVGLQLHDDVIDWEDDLARGGAWAVGLAAAAQASRPPGETRPTSMKRLVYESRACSRGCSRCRRAASAPRAGARASWAPGAWRRGRASARPSSSSWRGARPRARASPTARTPSRRGPRPCSREPAPRGNSATRR